MPKGYLLIKVDSESSIEFTIALDPNLSNGWRRDLESETRHRTGSKFPNDEIYFYTRNAGADDLGVRLIIRRKDAETLSVTNIFPVEPGDLTDAWYNGIQRDFHAQVLKTGFPSYIHGEKSSLMLTEAARRKLEAFDEFADKLTGSCHPADRERWADFLITSHRDHCFPDAAQLAEYLVQVRGWSQSQVLSLASELVFAETLLNKALPEFG